MIKANINELLFGPNEDIESLILSEIDAASKSIRVMAFWFTWKPIANKLVSAMHRGVDVELLLDRRSAEVKMKDVDEVNETLIPEYLVEHGISYNRIHIYNGELLHHKVILIDNSTVLTGTCNFFNASINRHEEHYMSITSEELSSRFNNRFDLLKEKSTTWPKN